MDVDGTKDDDSMSLDIGYNNGTHNVSLEHMKIDAPMVRKHSHLHTYLPIGHTHTYTHCD